MCGALVVYMKKHDHTSFARNSRLSDWVKVIVSGLKCFAVSRWFIKPIAGKVSLIKSGESY